MGHKVNPISFRLGFVKDWKSRWFSRKNYPRFLEEDSEIRNFVEHKLKKASVESVEITRSGSAISITIKTARPGLVIGRGGKGLEELQKKLILLVNKVARRRGDNPNASIKLEIEEIRRPETYARLVAKNIAEQVERRMPFRRVMKQTLEKVMQQKGVEGVKIALAGRLAGAEIARTEHLSKGKIPLQTLRADIDYAQENSNTTYGVIGVKVWIYKGEIFEREDEKK